MVNDFELRRCNFWSALEDELYAFIMDSVVYNELNELAFLRVMNEFMEYEDIPVFDDIYLTDRRLSLIRTLRNEFLDFFALYCSYYPERDSLYLVSQFKKHRITQSESKLEAFKQCVNDLLRN